VNVAVYFIRASVAECQVCLVRASCSDEANCIIHETLAFNNVSIHGDNSQIF